MQFVSSDSNYRTKMKALVKERHRLSFGTGVCFLVANQEFDLLGKQAADRGFPASSQNPGLLQDFPTEADRDVLFLAISWRHTMPRKVEVAQAERLSRMARVTRILREVKPQLPGGG
jgi:hypothetical protein